MKDVSKNKSKKLKEKEYNMWLRVNVRGYILFLDYDMCDKHTWFSLMNK